MAKLDRHGRKIQTWVTCDLSDDNSFCFFDQKGNARFPREDEESVENHLEKVFSIPYEQPGNLYEFSKRNRDAGFPFGESYYPYFDQCRGTETEITKCFIQGVKDALNESGIRHTIKARGNCSRRNSKTRWRFALHEFLIYSEDGVLLKLIGLQEFLEAGWKAVEDKMVAAEQKIGK